MYFEAWCVAFVLLPQPANIRAALVWAVIVPGEASASLVVSGVVEYSLASSSPLWTVSKVPPASFSRGTCHLHYLTSDSDPALTSNTLLFLQKRSSRRRYISHSFCFLLLHEKGRNKGRNLLLTPAPVVQTHQRIPSPLRSQSVAYIILQHTR